MAVKQGHDKFVDVTAKLRTVKFDGVYVTAEEASKIAVGRVNIKQFAKRFSPKGNGYNPDGKYE